MEALNLWIDDQVMNRCTEDHVLSVWVPEQAMIVLGSSNNPHRECHLEACAQDRVPVLKRRGGGGAVVLHPGCVVLSLGLWVEHPYQNDRYFSWINQAVIRCLRLQWPKLTQLEEKGISDLALGTRKLAGTSLFRSRNYLLYQASVLVEAGCGLMNRYLNHPGREPEYRQGRPHRDFVAGLSEFVPGLTSEILCRIFQDHFMTELVRDKSCRFTGSLPSQCLHLLRRAKGPGAFSPLAGVQYQRN